MATQMPRRLIHHHLEVYSRFFDPKESKMSRHPPVNLHHVILPLYHRQSSQSQKEENEWILHHPLQAFIRRLLRRHRRIHHLRAFLLDNNPSLLLLRLIPPPSTVPMMVAKLRFLGWVPMPLLAV